MIKIQQSKINILLRTYFLTCESCYSGMVLSDPILTWETPETLIWIFAISYFQCNLQSLFLKIHWKFSLNDCECTHDICDSVQNLNLKITHSSLERSCHGETRVITATHLPKNINEYFINFMDQCVFHYQHIFRDVISHTSEQGFTVPSKKECAFYWA